MNSFAGYCTVEPYIFFMILMSFLNFPLQQSYVYNNVCSKLFNSSICKDINDHKFAVDDAQKMSSHITFYLNVVYTVPQMFSAPILGALSDRIGRKYLMLFPAIGFTLAFSCFIFGSIFTPSSLIFIYFGNFFQGLGGAYVSVYMLAYSYIVDISSTQYRTMRLSIAESFNYLGAMVGLLSGGYLQKKFGYSNIWICFIVLSIIMQVYVIIWLPNARPKKYESGGSCLKIDRLLLRILPCIRKRLNWTRAIIFLLIGATCMDQLAGTAESDILYLYTHKKPLSFNDVQYGLFIGTKYASCTIGTILILPILSKKLKVHDIILLMCGLFSKAFSEILLSIAFRPWIAFCVPIVGLLANISAPSARSYLSKLVNSNEIGAIFSILAVFEALISIVASGIFNYLYPATLSWWSGFSFFLIAGFLGIGFVLALISRFLCRDNDEGVNRLSESDLTN